LQANSCYSIETGLGRSGIWKFWLTLPICGTEDI